jgi:hypothetical protein
VNDADLAELEHENLVSAFSTIFGFVDGAFAERANGVASILTGFPTVFYNQILVDAPTPDGDAITRAVAHARTRGHAFAVSLRVGADDAVVPLMAQLALEPVSEVPWIPGMAMYPLAANGSTMPEGHEIVRVCDERTLEDHITATSTGFGMPIEWVRGGMTMSVVEQPEVALYTGYADGAPVSTGVGFRTGRTLGVYDVSTVPGARRRGYGEHMSRHVIQEGMRDGCDVGILQASEMGKPIYERIGYRTVVEYMGYMDPGQ